MRKGQKVSLEIRKKMSLSAKGRHLSEDAKKHLSLLYKGKPSPFKGKKHSEKSKIKISKNNAHFWLGKKKPPFSKETIEKMRQAQLRNPNRYWLGKKMGSPSLETRKKMSDFMKGNKYSIGYKHTDEARKKMSLWRIGKFSGEKCHFWKGGISPKNKIIRQSIEYRLWREAVFARDGWICQKTGIKGGKLHPHHIENFSSHPELRFAIDNGITLSEKSHKEFHKKYGKINNTKEQIEEFLK